ncbi:MAG: nicotinamide mononucleotide transporter [Anaerolineae bacterium]|nr:nicotinamide mononucleotide transporter [Gemmatimonadaceae bacterium]
MPLQDILSPLQTPAFTSWGAPTSWAELFGFISGAVCVWLVARQNIWSWPIGLLNNALFLVLFFAAKLYADAALQVVFAILGVYGWYRWLRPRDQRALMRVRRTTAREWATLAVCGVFGVGAVTHWLTSSTDSPVPFWDSTVLVLSLLATYGQANKLLESWWLWITVDVISVPLYASRSLYLTAILYAGFLLLCLVGLRDWSRDLTLRAVEHPA